ncbi:uncharacterized protein LOC101851945 [Aplysia californica]|uniref:Uncharacterized protein LOC101851945 n=1 Tax=Aplysia californica TaxID=6500 RepID=A0ABM0JM94_APLCA|nr:uncharacterized protein LOC101851945 [Aplysia californica]
MWDLESVGIVGNENNGMPTPDEEKVLKTFNKDILFDGNRYEVRLPWKNRTLLMTNEEEAYVRLERLTRKLSKNPQLRERYDSVLADLEKDGIIHEISQDELETEQTVFYLPHRPVVREDSITTKVRPVFDASARGKNGISLNDCIETGPNLIPELIQVLLRFRRWKFGLTADIQKAFLQIKLNKEDQNVHRFLWDVNNQIRVMRFDRVIFGNACSPFLLNATLRFHLEKFADSRTVRELRENLYVDDWLTGADTEEELVEMMTKARETLEQGGFPLTKWASNSCRAREATGKTFHVSTEATGAKVTGISWNTVEDCFNFETLEVSTEMVLTKRKLLSIIARVFDPLGMLTPYTITL